MLTGRKNYGLSDVILYWRNNVSFAEQLRK